MIALTGTIGVGIWLNLGQTLSRCGPLLLLCAYLTSGIVMAATMLSLGEVTTLAPVTGAYARHSSVFSAPSLGFATGWNLVIYNAIACAGEVTSCAVLIQYWTDISPAVFVTILGLAIVATNIVGTHARSYPIPLAASFLPPSFLSTRRSNSFSLGPPSLIPFPPLSPASLLLALNNLTDTPRMRLIAQWCVHGPRQSSISR